MLSYQRRSFYNSGSNRGHKNCADVICLDFVTATGAAADRYRAVGAASTILSHAVRRFIIH